MARKLIIHLLFISISLSLLPDHYQCASSESKGFRLKLVRRNFHDDPQLFNLTESSFGSNISESGKIDRFRDYIIRPPITRSSFLYTIDASIGTPGRKRTFIFDTGSSLTWTQCKPCVNCFKQGYPLFDPKKSSSYQKLSPNHSLARFFGRSNNGECSFNVSYASGQSCAGVGSVETFTFPSSKKIPESTRGIVFGCSNNHKGQFAGSSLITGIMGMNRSPLSLIGQIGPKSVRRFSYCLPKINSPTKSTFLRFGNDISQRGNFRKTSFLRATRDYSVRLLNLSIGGRILNVPKGTFSSGCTLDVGSGTTHLEMPAYNAVKNELRRHFDRFNLTRVNSDPRVPFDLCYRLHRGFRNYPGLVFHFEGADYDIGPETLFRFMNDRFCLALFGTEQLTTLGAYQQQNVRFIYDVGNDKLLFAKEDCSKDKA